MSAFRLEPRADQRLDEIYDYTRRRWNERQADLYLRELFAQFQLIADRRVAWRPVPIDFGVHGFRRVWKSHVIYWREDAPSGLVVIVSVLHVSMDQPRRLLDDLRLT